MNTNQLMLKRNVMEKIISNFFLFNLDVGFYAWHIML